MLCVFKDTYILLNDIKFYFYAAPRKSRPLSANRKQRSDTRTKPVEDSSQDIVNAILAENKHVDMNIRGIPDQATLTLIFKICFCCLLFAFIASRTAADQSMVLRLMGSSVPYVSRVIHTFFIRI